MARRTTLLRTLRRAFADDSGAIWTEYLMLLGLLVGSVAIAGTLFAAELSTAYGGWASWIATALSPA